MGIPFINILGDALHLKMIALHLVVQRQEVEGVPAGAPCLEMRQEIPRVYFSVDSLGVT